MKPRSVLLAAAFLACAAQSQPRYVRESWTTAQGLPQSSVRALVQTRDGYLWLATFGGLARFDGTRFVVFDTANTPNLKSNRILALFEDRGGTLWIGTETGGLSSHRDGVFRSFATPAEVWAIGANRDGSLWIETSDGALRLRNGRFEKDRYRGPRLEARDGSHWFNDGGVAARVRNGVVQRHESIVLDRYPFYESDCQGRFSSLLIAFRSSPLQSAPTDRLAPIVRTRGWADQSFAADSSSISPLSN